MVDLTNVPRDMGDLEEDSVVEALQKVMAEGGNQAQEALQACQEGMDTIGERFENGEYYVGDLVYAGELMTKAVTILKDALVENGGDGDSKTKIILCTVKNDIHDIGKNIVKAMLEAAGFEVVDLGIDVSPEAVVEAVTQQGIHIVALSGVLTLAIDSMKDTVDAITDAGLRDDVKIIIGGSPVSEEARGMTGADEWAINPQKTVDVCRGWSSEGCADKAA